MSAPAPSTALPDTLPCPRHPERAAVGTCTRCGGFYCEAEAIQHGARTYCEACGHLPEVSHLERMRQELWGKRDGWAWLMLKKFGVVEGGKQNLDKLEEHLAKLS